ncbi:PD-(D/E)XK nuclease family protein [Aquabacterium sp.]|uniref:PD-(D/E)XK nuclease family protein n=1 Tax=Aquabacterium sp. TaxID=1872578 RepID=UPI003BB17AEE
MTLTVRPQAYSLPAYSLTGDLMGFLRCGLQYRYTRIGRLPPSKPVQLWFGEFIHGVLEEAFRRYKETVLAGAPKPPPWEQAEVDSIRDLIKARLAARGLRPWDPDLEELGDRRAQAAIQEMGPHLFPLIHKAEVRLHGARMLPPIDPKHQFREADRYEMVGVVDVVTHIELKDPALADNLIVKQIREAIGPNVPDQFEIIIDYKGMRRPSQGAQGAGSLWEQYEWQIQTYAELRRKQPDALPVLAGVLLYVNELAPTKGDLETLKREMRKGETDTAPAPGSEAHKVLSDWTASKDLPDLPLEFRLRRALRVVPVCAASIQTALTKFDGVVLRIETCKGREAHGVTVLQAWERNAEEEQTCVVCDSRTYCPDYQVSYASKHGEKEPRIPAVRLTTGP